jgi:hypothetical protein
MKPSAARKAADLQTTGKTGDQTIAGKASHQ